MCRIARFTCFQNIVSSVISLSYNELALLVQRIYISAILRHCGCDCNIRKRGSEEVKSYKNTYANTIFGTFRLMLDEAVNRGIIKTNPAAAVKKLKNGRKAIEIIIPAEVRLLFPRQWETVWGDGRVSCPARYSRLRGISRTA
jgi:hypothetical protein